MIAPSLGYLYVQRIAYREPQFVRQAVRNENPARRCLDNRTVDADYPV